VTASRGRGIVLIAQSTRGNSLALWDVGTDSDPVNAVNQDSARTSAASDVCSTVLPHKMLGLKAVGTRR